MNDARVLCRTLAEVRAGVATVSQKTFDLLSNAIQAVLADGDIKKNEIGEPCIFHIVPADLDCSGRLGRHVMPVQRDMDVRRDMVRESERPMVIGWRETP